MKLTEEEKEELEYLRSLKDMKTEYLSQQLQDRYKYLLAKEFHNCCSSPHCKGYEGNENETNCPKCGGLLYKTI